MRGGEKCLEALCEIFPEAPIFTLFEDPEKLSQEIRRHRITPSFLQKFPNIHRFYRYYLPLFPAAARSFKIRNADLLISTSHCAAKGFPKRDSALHISYCFTPMRYAWGLFDEYFGKKNVVMRAVLSAAFYYLRQWDKTTSAGVDQFVAISDHVRQRIRASYDRDAEIIYPPVDTVFFTPDASKKREDFYLVASALVPYKRIDLVVQTFNTLGRKLVVIGTGPEEKRLRRMASGNIEWLGWQSDEVLRDYYRRAKALIFPGEEDFGIVPVEMQACGGPVIAFEKGGALETVVRGKTGVFFETQTPIALAQALESFERMRWDPSASRENAERFSRERFKREMVHMIDRIAKKKGLKFHVAVL